MQSVRLPNDLDKIEFGCFYNCKNLRKIVIQMVCRKSSLMHLWDVKNLKFIFRRVSKNRKIYYPDGCKKIYCQKNTVAQKYAKKNKVAVEITGTKRTQQNYVAQKLLLKEKCSYLKARQFLSG